MTQTVGSSSNLLTPTVGLSSNLLTQTVGSSSNSSGSMFDDHFDVSCFPLQGIPNTDLLENSSGTWVEDNVLIQDFDFIGNLEQDNFDFSDNSDPFN